MNNSGSVCFEMETAMETFSLAEKRKPNPGGRSRRNEQNEAVEESFLGKEWGSYGNERRLTWHF